MTPVVLVGTKMFSNRVAVVGLYESVEAASKAVQSQLLPSGQAYAIYTPEINGVIPIKPRNPNSL